ncbi:MAG: hypothetical protein PHF24_07175, partial [Syntrophomonas sp.]|nr:hypothetical protein [Syntrophomonas sp.]
MKIKVGMFGFGKTGFVVAQEIINDKNCDLTWVLRKSTAKEGEYASHLLGFEHDEGKIFSIQNIDKDLFYKENYADVIIDFSAANAIEYYHNAVKYGTRIVSAVSKYDRVHLEQLKKLSQHSAVLYSPNITLGINFLIEASK